MKRSLIFALVVIILAGWLGTLIARDPGYVLIAYEDFSLQTSLWVLIALIVLITVAFYYTIRFVRAMFGAWSTFGIWQDNRRVKKSNNLTNKGMALLAEGETSRAVKFLEGGAANNQAKGINYLAAARAADEAGDSEARETFLRMSEESDASLGKARCVTTAELALRRGDYAGCLAALEGLTQNDHVLGLQKTAQAKLGNYEGMLALVPLLRKQDKSAALDYEAKAALLAFEDLNADEARSRLFKSLSGETRANNDVLLAYANALDDKGPCEPLLRAAIKQAWDEQLVVCYAGLPDSTLKVRSKNAAAWLKQHEGSAALQYCLGRIHEAEGEKDQAKAAYSKSIEIGGLKDARVRLAVMLGAAGDLKRSNEQLLAALGAES